MTPEARARVLRAPRPERPRQQRGSPTGASTHQTGGPSTFAIPGFAAQGPSTEPYTPSPMAPPTEGFFVGAFQPYSSMMTAPHQLHTSVAPLSVYPPHRPDFGYSYGMVQHTPLGSLFATGPSGSGHDVHDDVEADESEEDENDEDALYFIVRYLPRFIICHWFEEIPAEIVVHQIVGPGDIGDIRDVHGGSVSPD
ncbi:hypothetical protein V6N13_059377 [Hibiscus sabdariffa]